MAVINISTISKLTQNNPMVRSVFVWTVNFMLHLLESQRLIDRDKVYKASLDWERGSLDLGNSFTEQLTARTVSKFLIDRKLKEADQKLYGRIREEGKEFDRN